MRPPLRNILHFEHQNTTWPKTVHLHLIRPLSTFALRPYQIDCLNACFDALNAGVRRIGVSLPTGAGKTAVFISLLSRLESKGDCSRHSLVIVNSVELARQTAVLATKLRPDWAVEIEQGAMYHASGTANLCVIFDISNTQFF